VTDPENVPNLPFGFTTSVRPEPCDPSNSKICCFYESEQTWLSCKVPEHTKVRNFRIPSNHPPEKSDTVEWCFYNGAWYTCVVIGDPNVVPLPAGGSGKPPHLVVEIE